MAFGLRHPGLCGRGFLDWLRGLRVAAGFREFACWLRGVWEVKNGLSCLCRGLARAKSGQGQVRPGPR